MFIIINLYKYIAIQSFSYIHLSSKKKEPVNIR